MSGKTCHCEEGLPEWIMSYADMITILMAFFVVMYSMAGNKDTAREEAVLQALRNQFGPMMHGLGTLLPAMNQHPNSPVDLPFKNGTRSKNKNRGGVDGRHWPEGDHARIHSPWPGEPSRVGGVVYFPNDDTTLSEAQQDSLKLIADELGGKPQKIEVRGHTARKQGSASQRGQDPWDQAYARARATADYLVSLGIDPQRIRLGVAGENEPMTEAGGTVPYNQQSRVEVFMLNEVGEADAQRTRTKTTEPTLPKPEKKSAAWIKPRSRPATT